MKTEKTANENSPYYLDYENLDKKIPDNYDNLAIPQIEEATKYIQGDILKNKIYNYLIYYYNKGKKEGIMDSIYIHNGDRFREGVKRVAYQIDDNNVKVQLISLKL